VKTCGKTAAEMRRHLDGFVVVVERKRMEVSRGWEYLE
jgi:hypothetical protein